MSAHGIMPAMAERGQINFRASEPFKAFLQDVANSRASQSGRRYTLTDLLMNALAMDPELTDAVLREKMGSLMAQPQDQVVDEVRRAEIERRARS